MNCTVNKNEFIENLWNSLIERKYLGIRKMKTLAKILLNNDKLFTTADEFFIEYKKYRLSEWLEWSDSNKIYSIYKCPSGRMQLRIKEDLYDTGKLEEIDFKGYDANLNLVYNQKD